MPVFYIKLYKFIKSQNYSEKSPDEILKQNIYGLLYIRVKVLF